MAGDVSVRDDTRFLCHWCQWTTDVSVRTQSVIDPCPRLSVRLPTSRANAAGLSAELLSFCQSVSLSVYRSAGHDGPASSSNRETVQPLLWSLRAHGSVFCLSIWQSVNSSSLSLSLAACACVRMCVMVCMETGQYSFHCFVYVCTLARACCCSFQRNFSS